MYNEDDAGCSHNVVGGVRERGLTELEHDKFVDEYNNVRGVDGP